MKSLIIKDKLNHKSFYKLEKKRLILKGLAVSCFLPPEIRLSAAKKLWNLGKIGSRSIVKKRCLLTNRGRSINYKLGYSRSMLKILISDGQITRAKKRSW